MSFLAPVDDRDVSPPAPHVPPPIVRSVRLQSLAPELAWLAERGLEVRLPHDGHRPAPPSGTPVLHVLGPSGAPPLCGPLEDWIREPVDRDDLIARADRLLGRARQLRPAPVAIVDGVLRAGDLVEVLSPQEERLLAALLAVPDQLVARDDLVTAVWPDGPPSDPRALDNRVKTLRRRLGPFPLRLHTVRGRGLLVELLVQR